ncbi:MAG: CHASE2 domain-containing protein, partial [Chloroflexota bacterium]|nr:CHASE2 domain-containing protein [Chloroflexota bacterium]
MPTILARLPERARATLSIAALSAALTLIIWAGGLFMSVRLRATDVYFVTSSAAEQTVSSDRIALIALDDASFQAYGRSLTDWDRAIYADLIDRLAQSGARVIGFDLIFSETSQSDTAFADALTRIRQSDARTRIILPIAGVGMPLPAQRTLGSVLSPTQRSLADAIRFSNRLAPIAVLAERADYLAYVNTVIDVDGVVRRQPSIIQSDDTVRYGFSLATYLAYLRIPEAAASQIVALETDGLRVAENLLIPKDELGLWRQNFFGLPNESFATYSLVEVIDGTVDPSAFTDKIVLVGLMNSQGIADSYNIPLADNGDFMAGVEILAHAVTTLLEGGVPSEQPPLSVALMLIGISALASVLFIRQGWLGKVITLIAMLVAIFVIGSIDFSVRRELISLFDAVLAVLIPVGLAFGYEIRSERRSRLRAESRFESAEGQRRLISAIFQRSPLPIALVDGQFRIYRINAAFTRIFESLSAAQDSAAPPANTWLIGLFAAAGMTAAEQTSAQNAIQSASVDPLKVAFGGK